MDHETEQLIVLAAREFRMYEAQHRDKASDPHRHVNDRNEHMLKAKANCDLAEMYEARLASLPPSYHELAMRTAAGPEVFHYAADDDESFFAAVFSYLRAAARLDEWKSKLFYNKIKPSQIGIFGPDFSDDSLSLAVVVNPQLIHAVLGVATEGAELMHDLVRFCDEGPGVELALNMEREQGDVDWYQELLATSIGIPVEDSRKTNIERLAKRYPDKFSEAAALDRADEKGDPVAGGIAASKFGGVSGLAMPE